MQGIHQTQPQHVGRSSTDVRQEEFRAARRNQRVPIAVAPYTSLAVARGGKALTLRAGDEVLPADFIGESTVQVVLQRLVDRDAVIALDEGEIARLSTSSTARYLVADGRAISTKRGIVSEGCEVTAADFARGQLDLDNLVERGAVIDRKPEPPPKQAA